MLKKQVRFVQSDKTVPVRGHNGDRSRPLKSEIGRFASADLEKKVKQSLDANAMWHSSNSTFGTLGCWLIQLYSYKSQVSLTASTLMFYPLYVALLNIREGKRRKVMLVGKATVAYLSVSFQEKGDKNDERGMVSKLSSNSVKLLSSLHKCNDFCLKPISDKASCGLVCTTTDGKKEKNVFYLLLASYIADIPESEDILAIKRDTQKVRPNHLCLLKRENHSVGGICTKRTLSKSFKILFEIDKKRKSVNASENVLMEYSMHPPPSSLASFQFFGTHESVDIYSIFWVEPVHTLSLTFDCIDKECLVAMLTDTTRTSPEMETIPGVENPVSSIKRTVLAAPNTF